jgi:BirA family biotin operon repressor/biotin-[acetyl-CoA-carboxylase] ligase
MGSGAAGPGGVQGRSPWPPEAWHITKRQETSSTQDLAIAAAHANAPTRSAFIAARQTAGRGRDGREWRAPEGNLNFSALLRPGPVMPVPAQWSLMAGIALHEAVATFLPDGAALMLKWPNDLLLSEAKLAGILVDSALTPAGRLDWVVIGMGVNLAEAPSLPDRATTCLSAHGARVTPDELAGGVMAALDRWAGADLPAICAGWLARAHKPGTSLRVHQGGQVVEGVFEGLGEDGSLRLRGHAPVSSGEVFLEGAHAAGG